MIPKGDILKERNNLYSSNGYEIASGSNCIRLSGHEWIFVGIVVLILFCFMPALWVQIEKFEPEQNYRLSYDLSSDYWLYERYCKWVCSRYEVLVIGDSVIWGDYVSRDETITKYLNEIAGYDRFANLALDGIHPVALAGLLENYGHNISGEKVVLHFNPLWMSSRRHDLQTEKEFRFNHPRLVPQFYPNIPCYKESFSRKISTVVERKVSFLSWISHLKIAYFGNMDVPTWTMEHPYENPIQAVTLEIPIFVNDNQNKNIPWFEKGMVRRDYQWVELDTSLQWSFFRQLVKLLKERGNNVFVVVGPLNEHMMKGDSIEVYGRIKSDIEVWLQQNNVAYYMPLVLPSELYADVSHLLGEGYAMLAEQLFENEFLK